MFRPLVRIAAAALVAGVIALAINAAPAVNAVALTQAQDAKHMQPGGKADRLRVPVRGAACSVHGWPAFEPKCQFDTREPDGKARTVRVIALR